MVNLNIYLRVPSRLIRWGLAGLLLATQAGELASEDLTLTTYYPAPSGVYKKMITTADTVLARNSGSVGIGTSRPTGKLDVHDGDIALSSTSVPGTGIVFTDGTKQTTASAGRAIQYTFTSQATGAGNISSFPGCNGASVSLTLSQAEDVQIGVSLNLDNFGGYDGYGYLWVQVDGQFVPGETSTQFLAISSYIPASSGGFLSYSFFDHESAGSHTYCFGVGTFQNTTCHINPLSRFWVKG